MSRRARRGSASDASQQEGEPPADELGGESATALLLSKLAEVTGQLSELQSEVEDQCASHCYLLELITR